MRTDHYIDVRIRSHRAESPALYARIDEVIERSPRAAAATIRRLADLGVMVEQGRLSSGVPRAVVTRVLAVPQAFAARVPADTTRERTHELVAHQAAESAELAMPASPTSGQRRTRSRGERCCCCGHRDRSRAGAAAAPSSQRWTLTRGQREPAHWGLGLFLWTIQTAPLQRYGAVWIRFFFPTSVVTAQYQ